MTLSRLLNISISAAITLAASATELAQKKGETAQKWEFLTLSECDSRIDRSEGKVTFQDFLDAAGEQGWDLVAVTATDNACARWAFKRLKTERSKPFTLAPRAPQPPAPKCSLTPTQAPAVRGLRLGMSVEELFALFPGGSEDRRNEQQEQLARAAQPPNFGETSFEFTTRNFSSGKDRFLGVWSVGVTVFDRRVFRVTVTYSDSNWSRNVPVWSVDEWIKKLSEALGLPGPEYWERQTSFSGEKVLKCVGFEAVVRDHTHTMTYEFRDTTYRAQQEQRRKAWREERQREFKP
jgi:hypothetical protein